MHNALSQPTSSTSASYSSSQSSQPQSRQDGCGVWGVVNANGNGCKWEAIAPALSAGLISSQPLIL
ncbi:hypothetical protein IQ268_10550 [Oculatella sp. LEGE 06141]|uniref:hypothetical protein n=1 Tax=Oculatella sp. LEGE 06141 TaxID=1828648 RepID=UPI00187F5D2E|nr:hypothetical protein [Oculatella sp. LEGE 06141]MBE9178999.1 hypothetical protein [Oculatella sp. LEGE 06141]